ncbi:hypothetical protein Tco_1162581 [Tanacetum coccineum]
MVSTVSDKRMIIEKEKYNLATEIVYEDRDSHGHYSFKKKIGIGVVPCGWNHSEGLCSGVGAQARGGWAEGAFILVIHRVFLSSSTIMLSVVVFTLNLVCKLPLSMASSSVSKLLHKCMILGLWIRLLGQGDRVVIIVAFVCDCVEELTSNDNGTKKMQTSVEAGAILCWASFMGSGLDFQARALSCFFSGTERNAVLLDVGMVSREFPIYLDSFAHLLWCQLDQSGNFELSCLSVTMAFLRLHNYFMQFGKLFSDKGTLIVILLQQEVTLGCGLRLSEEESGLVLFMDCKPLSDTWEIRGFVEWLQRSETSMEMCDLIDMPMS